MTQTTCPSCDAPAPRGARRCARCGYGFLEDGAGPARARPGRRAGWLAAGALMAVVLAAAIGRTVLDKTSYSSPGQDGAEHSRLEVLSERPLSRRALERVLEDRYLPVPDDDEADVHCSGRIAKPAHSVRRCEVIYSEGVRRGIVLLTNARGAEVLSEP